MQCLVYQAESDLDLSIEQLCSRLHGQEHNYYAALELALGVYLRRA